MTTAGPAAPEVAGLPPEGTLRRAIADASHERWCGPDHHTCPRECQGRMDRAELDAVAEATRVWVEGQLARKLEKIARAPNPAHAAARMAAKAAGKAAP